MGERISEKALVKQATILVTAGLLVRLLGFAYRIPMTAIIGNSGNAAYSAGFQIYNFLLILSSAGLPAAIGKMVSERLALKEYKNAHKVFIVALFGCGILSFLFMIVMFVFAEFIAVNICGINNAEYTIRTLAPTVFIVGIMSVFRGYFQGMNNMMPTAISQIIEQIFNAIFSVLLAWLLIGKGVEFGAAGGTAGTGIGAVFGLAVLLCGYFFIKPKIKKKVDLPMNYREETIGEIGTTLVRIAVPIIIGTAMFSITNLADLGLAMDRLEASGAFIYEEAEILYGQLHGKYAVLTTLPVAISTAMATATIPSIATSVTLRETDEIKKKINLIIKLAMMVSIPAAVGMGVLAKPIFLLIFPTTPDGWELVSAGSIAIIFLALNQIVTGILQGLGKVKIPAMNAAVGAVVKIALNYMLIVIPAINIKGAIISTTVCYMLVSILNVIALIKTVKFIPDLVSALVKPIFSALVMSVICYFSYLLLDMAGIGNTISTLVAIVVGIGVYGVVMLLVKGINKEELSSIPMGNKMIPMFEKLRLI